MKQIRANYGSEYANLREKMIKTLKIRGIKDRRTLEAMGKIPRHIFVPENMQEFAYDDSPLPIGENQTISQPYIVAAMSEYLELNENDKVLEIGTGSGYQTAILCYLSARVYTIEINKTLLKLAQANLRELGFSNVHYKLGDGSIGWEENAPFNKILVTAACPFTPPPLIKQLSLLGILILPIGPRYSQILTIVRKGTEKILHYESTFECAFVPLIGKYGFQD